MARGDRHRGRGQRSAGPARAGLHVHRGSSAAGEPGLPHRGPAAGLPRHILGADGGPGRCQHHRPDRALPERDTTGDRPGQRGGRAAPRQPAADAAGHAMGRAHHDLHPSLRRPGRQPPGPHPRRSCCTAACWGATARWWRVRCPTARRHTSDPRHSRSRSPRPPRPSSACAWGASSGQPGRPWWSPGSSGPATPDPRSGPWTRSPSRRNWSSRRRETPRPTGAPRCSSARTSFSRCRST